MASKCSETPTNLEKTVGISSRRFSPSGGDRSSVFQPGPGNSGNQLAFERIEPQSKTSVPALPQPATEASAANSEENSSPLTIRQKPTFKYRPPDFRSTVI